MSAIGSNYSQPVLVNGYECWNCSQVAEAKKDINPAHPTSGPGAASGAAASSPTSSASATSSSPAVVFGGSLSGLNGAGAAKGAPSAPAAPSTGALLDLVA